MAVNILDEGLQIPVVLTAAQSSGDLVLLGSLFGIALTSGAIGDTIAILLGCRCTLKKSTSASTAITQGAHVYWDSTNKWATGTSSGNTLIGVAGKTSVDADATQVVLLNKSY